MTCGMRRAVDVGSRSIRENAVPLAVLWGVSATSAIAYYSISGAAAVFGPLARWQTAGGWAAAFLNRVVFCGILPGVFLVSVRSIRPHRPLLTTMAYALWGGLWGIACDAFFTLQSQWFGCGTDVATLVKKTLADQLIWNVFVCTPVNALFFPWVARDFLKGPPFDGRRFVCEVCPALLVSNWIVWIPVMTAVYAFPLPLQIQLVGLASSFWMLVALRAAAKGSGK